MDQYIRASIDSRRKVIDDYYTIPDVMKDETEGLFHEMEELGENAADVSDFETRFAESTMNQRYLDLFTQLKIKGSVVAGAVKDGVLGRMKDKDSLKDDAETAMGRAVDDLTLEQRAEMRQDLDEKIYDTPVLGDIVTASRVVDSGLRLFKKKKKN